MSTIETTASTASMEQENAIIQLIVYENDKQITFDQLSGNEYQSITSTLAAMLDVYENDIYSSGEDEQELFVKNVKYEYINHIGYAVARKYTIDTKIPVKLSNWGVNQWGNVQFLFKLV